MSKQLKTARALFVTLSLLGAPMSQANEMACTMDLQQQIQQDLESAKGSPSGRVIGGATTGLSIGAIGGFLAGGSTGVAPVALGAGLLGGVGGMTVGGISGAAASTAGMNTELKDIPLYSSAQHLIELMDTNTEAHQKETAELRSKVPSLSLQVASAAIQEASTQVMSQSRCGISLDRALTTENLVNQYLATLSRVLR